MHVYVRMLTYEIFCNDSDEGDIFAGDGCKILGIYNDYEKPQIIVDKFRPIIEMAEK